MKIFIFGEDGFLGTKLSNKLNKDYIIIKSTKKDLDALNQTEVIKKLKKEKPDIIINTIGIANTLFCENNPEIAKEINFLTTKNIIRYCKNNKCKLIFISSSYIFNGKNGRYGEKEPTDPLNEYGRTKVMAEEEIKKLEDYCIIRTDFLYGYNGKEKPNGIISQILKKNEIEVYNSQQIRQPLLIDDMAKTIKIIINQNIRGILNVAGEEEKTKKEIYEYLTKIKETPTKLIEKKIEVKVENPKISTLDISKIKKYGFKPTSLNKGIKKIKETINLL